MSDDGLRAYISRQPNTNRVFMASRQDLTDSFGPAAEVAELHWDGSANGAVLLPDELTIFFNSNGNGGLGSSDIYTATRASTDSSFGTPQNVSELNTGYWDGGVCVSRDGLSMFFTSSRPPHLGGGDIWHSWRPDLSSPWAAPVKVEELSTSMQEGVGQGCANHPGELYYHRDVGGNRLQIFSAIR